jgi:hypothetical protein
MRCSDENYYVVKFQNNPQHRRILVNELLGTRLAARMKLPTAAVRVIEVSEELIRLTPELCIDTPRARIPCTPGLQFGSRFPIDPRHVALHDFLPDEQLRRVDNVHEFAGMLVFDKWTCNTNGRQTVFYIAEKQKQPASPGPEPNDAAAYHTVMIDQGFCFNAGEWNFPDAPLRGLYARNRVYEGVIGMESFAPWLDRLEKINDRVLAELAEEIPPEWYEDEYDTLLRLLEQVFRRRPRVPELLLSARNCNRQPFPNWRG